MKVRRPSLLVYVGIISLCATAWAKDLLHPTRSPHPPQTVTLETDMVFHVPFSVSGDTVLVKAGTQVSLKGVGDKYIKLAYGPAELTVDPAQTDFTKRMQELPKPTSPQVSNTAATASKHSSASNGSAVSPRSSGKTKQVEIPWMWMSFILIPLLLAAVGVWAFKEEIKRHHCKAPRQDSHEFVSFSFPTHSDLHDAVSTLDWFQLEKLVAALFRAKGNFVDMRGGASADGGVDLVVDSESAKAAVQCKHWSKWKCGPGVVRELIGSMKHEGFSRGFLVCRTATRAALHLAAQEQITIIDRDALVDRIAAAMDADNEEVKNLLFNPEKLCPKCGSAMVRRTSAKVSNTGSEFWGCSKYPNCRQTMRA